MKKKFWLVLFGIFIGFINGFFGGGGGMIAVPVLSWFLKPETKKAHATAIAIILPLSIISATLYLIKAPIALPLIASTGGGVVFGGIIGAFLLKKIKNRILNLLFYLLMITAGVVVLLR